MQLNSLAATNPLAYCRQIALALQHWLTDTDAPQVLQRISDGVAAFIMDRADYTVPMARAAARELLATCVLKQIVALFTPYNLNKVCTRLDILPRRSSS